MSDLNFYERFNELQTKLKAPKNQYNSFGKYRYRNAEDILEAVKPLNNDYKVTLLLKDDIVQFGERFYVKATATLIDSVDPNNKIEASAFARESLTKKGQDDSQITGTASSYARKYALNGLYLIDDTKDADTDEYQNQNKSPQSKPAKQKDIGVIKTKVMRFADMREKKPVDVYKALSIKEQDLPDFTEEQSVELIEKLDSWIKKADKEMANK